VNGDISRFKNGLLHGGAGVEGDVQPAINCLTATPNGGKTATLTGTMVPPLSRNTGHGKSSGCMGN
jgi:hypothetical protein